MILVFFVDVRVLLACHCFVLCAGVWVFILCLLLFCWSVV